MMKSLLLLPHGERSTVTTSWRKVYFTTSWRKVYYYYLTVKSQLLLPHDEKSTVTTGTAHRIECQTRDQKVVSLNPGKKWWENFLLRSQLCVLTVILCPFHPHVTIVACKKPQSFCQKCRWQVTPNMHTSSTQRSQSGPTMTLSRHSVGTHQETSSHATRQGIFGHSCLSSLSHCGLILA